MESIMTFHVHNAVIYIVMWQIQKQVIIWHFLNKPLFQEWFTAGNPDLREEFIFNTGKIYGQNIYHYLMLQGPGTLSIQKCPMDIQVFGMCNNCPHPYTTLSYDNIQENLYENYMTVL